LLKRWKSGKQKQIRLRENQMTKTNKEIAEILIMMRRLWDTAESFALAIGMNETDAAKFAAKELDRIVEQSKGETK
jgi:hypothetical protein